MADVIVKIPTIDRLVNALSNSGTLQIPMNAAASVVLGEVKKRWSGSLGANRVPTKPLTVDYARLKAAKKVPIGGGAYAGGEPKANFTLTSVMRDSLQIKKNTGKEVVIGFRPDQIPKAKGNANIRPNMMKIDNEPNMLAIAAKAFNLSLRKIIKLFS